MGQGRGAEGSPGMPASLNGAPVSILALSKTTKGEAGSEPPLLEGVLSASQLWPTRCLPSSNQPHEPMFGATLQLHVKEPLSSWRVAVLPTALGGIVP